MPMRESAEMAWMYLFGKKPIPTATPTRTTDRIVAVGCAMRIVSDSVIASGKFGDITGRAEKFEDWLKNADSEEDAQIRRLLLVMVCDKAAPSTPADRIRTLAKELHRHVTGH